MKGENIMENTALEVVVDNTKEELVEAATDTAMEVAKESIDWFGVVKTVGVYSLAAYAIYELGKKAAPHVMKLFNKPEAVVDEDIYEEEVTDIE